VDGMKKNLEEKIAVLKNQEWLKHEFACMQSYVQKTQNINEQLKQEIKKLRAEYVTRKQCNKKVNELRETIAELREEIDVVNIAFEIQKNQYKDALANLKLEILMGGKIS
jgi:septation ring formation regulator EzrA